tara:strand:+ start:2081 stop:3004 length:924 start_codon:yes stop_codon:yes gene_type:complete
MRFGLGFIFLSITFMLSSCTSGPSESEFAPKIGDIETSIVHSHPSVHAQAEYQRTIDVIVRMSIKDPDGLEDITDIYIQDNNNSRRWRLKESSVLNSDAQCKATKNKAETLEVIECSFFSKDRPDLIDLVGYEMVAVDRHGYSSRKTFEFKLPSGAVVEDEEFVYSDVFSGGPSNGIPALEVITLADNAMVFTLDEDAELLHLEFVSEDPRVREYGLELYDDSVEPQIVGEVLFDIKEIQENEIDAGVEIMVDIPWSQITFIGENNASNIYGLYVVLFDEAKVSTQLETVSEWFNYRGYSEFITLAP